MGLMFEMDSLLAVSWLGLFWFGLLGVFFAVRNKGVKLGGISRTGAIFLALFWCSVFVVYLFLASKFPSMTGWFIGLFGGV